MAIHIHIHNHFKNEELILQKLDNIMATIAELNAKVDELQAALDLEQEQIAASIATLQQAVTDLTQQLADGGTEAERQAVLDKLNSAIADLQSTIPE